MPSHDIIDNCNEKLADHINTILQGTEQAKFAVGYFFLSGFEAIKDRLKDFRELRILIGTRLGSIFLAIVVERIIYDLGVRCQ